jgi:hypothetical protein
MLGPRVSPSRSGRAAAVLGEVFGHMGQPFAFRLWDGVEARIGAGEPACVVVIHSPQALFRLLRDPSPLNFAEAFVEAAIDIEGDLFAAMKVACEVEDLTLPLRRRLGILASLWRP